MVVSVPDRDVDPGGAGWFRSDARGVTNVRWNHLQRRSLSRRLKKTRGCDSPSRLSRVIHPRRD